MEGEANNNNDNNEIKIEEVKEGSAQGNQKPGGFLQAVLDRPWEDITEEKNGGILKKIIKEGYGAKYPENKSEVEVHYEGRLEETNEKFDSSRDRNQKFKFKLGAGQVIKGWDLGVKTMKKGELSKFKIRADYAYGENGIPPKIPANATLLFDIELYDSRISNDVSDKKDGGVLKNTIKEGAGWEQPNDGTKVNLKYTILIGEDDLGSDEKEFSFVIGDELTYSGLDIAAKKMKKNEIATFTIRSDYIFNSAGNSDLNLGPIVPANSDLTLKIEMIDFVREKEPYQVKSSAEKFSIASAKKEEGNVFFKEGRLHLALKRYKKALSYIQYGEWKDMKAEVDQLLVSCHSNIAMILLKNSAFEEVLSETKRVIDIDPNNIKALYRRGAAFIGIREYQSAVEVLSKAASLEPENKEVKNSLIRARHFLKQEVQKDTNLYAAMLGGL